MDRNLSIGITFALGLVLYLVSNNAFAGDSLDVTPGLDVTDPNDTGTLNVIPPIDPTATLDQKVAAMLATIREFESNGDYAVLYGVGNVPGYPSHFSDFSKHPNIKIPILLPGYEGKYSTAAGAYQINHPTYLDFAPRVGVSDFSPATQDALALAILQDTGAVLSLDLNDIGGAFADASKRWASLPGSAAGQHPQMLAKALDVFNQYLGSA